MDPDAPPDPQYADGPAERGTAEFLLAIQQQVLDMVAAGAGPGRSLGALVRLLEAGVPGMFASIMLMDDDGAHLHRGIACGLPPECFAALDGTEVGPVAGSCGTAAYRRKPVIVSDIATDPLWEEYREAAMIHGLRACWSAPIFGIHHSVLGTFETWFAEPASPTPDQLRVMDMAVRTASLVLLQDKAEAAARESEADTERRLNRELRAISSCNQLLMRAVDEQALLNEVCRIICDEAGYCMAWVGYAEHDENKSIRPMAWAGADSGYIAEAKLSWSENLERGRGPAGEVIRSGEILFVRDFKADARMAPWMAVAVQRGYRSGFALPLKDRHEAVFGVLLIYSNTPSVTTPTEIRLLGELAGDLAFGIEVLRDRVELERAERERRSHLRFLECMDRVNRAMQGTSDLETMMSTVLDEVLETFGCDRAFLQYPCDPTAPTWSVPMERTRPEYPGVLELGLEIPMDDGVAGSFRTLLAAGGPVKFGVGNDHPMVQGLDERFGIKAFMAIALRPKIGKPWQFGLHQCSRARAWTPDDEHLLREIAHRLSDCLTGLLAHQRLQDSEARYRIIVDTATEGILTLGQDARVTFANARMAGMLGLTPQEMVGHDVAEVMLEEDVPDHRTKISSRHQGVSEHYERRFRHRDGHVLWTMVAATPRLDADGDFSGVIALVTDITERKQAEEALRAAHDELEARVQQRTMELARTNETLSDEIEERTRAEEARALAQAERDAVEVQLHHAQKLEAIGQLAAGIAHEINTPTQYVGDNTRFVQEAFETIRSSYALGMEALQAASTGCLGPELVERMNNARVATELDYLFDEVPAALSQALEGVERITKIVRAMREFSHPGGKEKAPADLNAAIESTVTVARNEWKYVADMQLDLDPELPHVTCFLGDFNQAILNLIVNAAHAISDVVQKTPGTKGTITVSTRTLEDQVEVCVCDTGGGIPDEVRPRLFEPFFTTKAVGRGTGQGLTVVYATIVKRHGGTVTFDSTVGIGTTFTIRLPISGRQGALDEAA